MGWFQQLIYGEDLDALQAQSNQLDTALAKLNKEALASGKYDESTFAAAEANRIKSYEEAGGADIEGDVNGVFTAAVAENAGSLASGVKETLRWPFKLIPWQWWLVIGVAGIFALFLYFPALGAVVNRQLKKLA